MPETLAFMVLQPRLNPISALVLNVASLQGLLAGVVGPSSSSPPPEHPVTLTGSSKAARTNPNVASPPDQIRRGFGNTAANLRKDYPFTSVERTFRDRQLLPRCDDPRGRAGLCGGREQLICRPGGGRNAAGSQRKLG